VFNPAIAFPVSILDGRPWDDDVRFSGNSNEGGVEMTVLVFDRAGIGIFCGLGGVLRFWEAFCVVQGKLLIQ